MSNVEELINKKYKLLDDVENIEREIRANQLENFVNFLHQQRKEDMLNQTFEEHHQMMEDIVLRVKNCLNGTDINVSYENYAEIIIDSEYSLSDKQDFICLSDDKAYLYDVISFFEEELSKRKEGKIEEVWINDKRLDTLIAQIEYSLDINLSWYENHDKQYYTV